MYGAQYVNQLRSIAMCGLVHKYVRKTTPEFTVEKLYNSQAGTVLPMERLDFYHCRQKYSGAVRGLPLCLGIYFGSGTGVAPESSWLGSLGEWGGLGFFGILGV